MATDSQTLRSTSSAARLRRAFWLAMLSMTSLFFSFIYGYLTRHTLSGDWMSAHLAEILSANTAILIASSLALWRSRQFLALRGLDGALRWALAAFVLGLVFLAGQAWAWRTLLAAGVYVATHPNSGFFFLVTAVHAAHLLLALALLGFVVSRLWRGRLPPDQPLLLDLTAIFWHCLDLTWLYLFVILLFYR